jgi:putative tricarboxylic transport membrane protein
MMRKRDERVARPMDLRLLTRKDVLAGLLFIAFAALGLWASRNYPLGTALRMSTGYVPRLLCWLLAGLGVVIAMQGILAHGERPLGGGVHLRPLIFVPLSVIVFALTVERFGIVVATVLLVVVGALAGRGLRTLEVALTALVLVVATVVIFIYGLDLTIRVWPEW